MNQNELNLQIKKKKQENLSLSDKQFTQPQNEQSHENQNNFKQVLYRPPNLQNYKTVLCMRMLQGQCQYADRCNFAHSDAELRPKVNNNNNSISHQDNTSSSLYKTMICKSFSAGSCRYGGNCNFAHGMHELRKHEFGNNQYPFENSLWKTYSPYSSQSKYQTENNNSIHILQMENESLKREIDCLKAQVEILLKTQGTNSEQNYGNSYHNVPYQTNDSYGETRHYTQSFM